MTQAAHTVVEPRPLLRARAKEVRVEFAPNVPGELARVFSAGLTRVLEQRSGAFHVRLTPGRRPDEVLAVIQAPWRRTPLPLFFPRADGLAVEDVERIVANVLEGMGPAFG